MFKCEQCGEDYFFCNCYDVPDDDWSGYEWGDEWSADDDYIYDYDDLDNEV